MPAWLTSGWFNLDDLRAQMGQQQRAVGHVVNLTKLENRHSVEHRACHGEVVYVEMSAAPPATVAGDFARVLRAAGVQRMYGLPGEYHLRILDAIAAEGLTYVAAREESGAVLMAATEAQAGVLPGVVLVTIAPGVTNAINGIAHAWLDRVPLLVVTGQHSPERAPLILRQSLDNHRLVDGLTKWTVTASGRIHQVLARALETALAPPAGPVLLELRDDVAATTP